VSPAPDVWSADNLRAKAALYFERAFDHDHDDEQFAFWCHLALEQLSRSALAQVSPALLAAPQKQSAVLYGLGLRNADPLQLDSASSFQVYQLCAQFVKGFGTAEKKTCEEARQRRNAELHSAAAAMSDLPRGWLGRFFAVCRVLATHLGIDLDDLLEQSAAELVKRLIIEDAADVRQAVREAIEAARARAANLSAAERGRREGEAEAELHPRFDPLGPSPFAAQGTPHPRVLREVACPACTTRIGLRGDIVTRNAVRLNSDGELLQTLIAVPVLLSCKVCELRLETLAELTVAGFGDPVTLTEYPDPVETFDIDLSNYQDEFMQMLADDNAYQDE
jgi:hypothetical protein